MLSAQDINARTTPIPTPGVVRAGGSVLVGISLAVLVSAASPAVMLGIAVGSATLAVALTLAHPYRREMRRFAEEKNVARVPSISMLVPLMLWWLTAMLAPLAAPWPGWAVLIAFVVAAALAWLLYPHVDGSRRLAYADTPAS
ncbi:hypothetical protein [Corynebacterium sp.]|uniref:hypothetical protein n=1 Tax=Corynebacterium sp. TaxID=1720 RepID=UPI002A9100CC|nr:hypothetical protein [Corynebacterium sp.]MDY5785924.1 hypothetical protein [Corynebacterium sp.]